MPQVQGHGEVLKENLLTLQNITTAGWHFSANMICDASTQSPFKQYIYRALYSMCSPTVYAEKRFTMFTSEMLSMLSTCTSMPTGMADPADQKTKHTAVMFRITAMPLKST